MFVYESVFLSHYGQLLVRSRTLVFEGRVDLILGLVVIVHFYELFLVILVFIVARKDAFLSQLSLGREGLKIENHLLLLNNQMVEFLLNLVEFLSVLIFGCLAQLVILIITSTLDALGLPDATRLRPFAVKTPLRATFCVFVEVGTRSVVDAYLVGARHVQQLVLALDVVLVVHAHI